MKTFALALFAGLGAGTLIPRSEVHGSGDGFAAPGVALAWGIERGASRSDDRRRRSRRDGPPEVSAGWRSSASIRSPRPSRCGSRRRAFRARSTCAFPRAQFARPPAHRVPFLRERRRCAREHAGARRLLPRRAGHGAGVHGRGRCSTRISRRDIAHLRKTSAKAMTRSELARLIDHSVLKPEATRAGHPRRARKSCAPGASATTACSRAGCASHATSCGDDPRGRDRGGRLSARLRPPRGQGARHRARHRRRRARDRHGHELRRAAKRRRDAGCRRHRRRRARSATAFRSR